MQILALEQRRDVRAVGFDRAVLGPRVRRAVGLEQQESDYKGTQLQNLDAFLNDFPDDDEYVHYCAGTDHFVMVVKLPGGFYRMLLSDRGEAAGPNVTPEQAFMRLADSKCPLVKK